MSSLQLATAVSA